MTTRNIIVISDIHAGCQFGLYPADLKIPLDGGGYYTPSKNQKHLWKCWTYFWDEWVPEVTKGEPYVLVLNGDAIDGKHHNTNTQITQNIEDQLIIAEHILKPAVAKAEKFYFIRGTEIHTGSSGQWEELLAKQLDAVKNKEGKYSRWELWLSMNGCLVHFSHHVGVTSSTAFESTAVFKELIEAYNHAGRWRKRPPDVVVRSHRHRAIEIRIPTRQTYGISCCSPGWQLKTPFTYRLLSGRASTPQVGGYLIRHGSKDMIYTRFKVWDIEQNREVEKI